VVVVVVIVVVAVAVIAVGKLTFNIRCLVYQIRALKRVLMHRQFLLDANAAYTQSHNIYSGLIAGQQPPATKFDSTAQQKGLKTICMQFFNTIFYLSDE